MEKPTIIFTGGGSGGHVMPGLTLISQLQSEFNILYVGSKKGIESEIVPKKGISYFSISTGKLRRYFSWENFKDFFRFIKGIFDAFFFLLRRGGKNTLVFSTGGFVTVPVVIAAKLTGTPLFVHEQTSQVGLANKIASRFAKNVFITFKSSEKFFPKNITVWSGYPLRSECFRPELSGNLVNGIDLNSLSKPLLFITGGGNGSLLLNEFVKSELEELKKKYFIIHQVGSAFEEEYQKFNDENYQAFAFIDGGMVDLFKKADVVISRAGAGTVAELMAVKKPSIFIPLKIAQKNEQYHNAMEAAASLGSLVVTEDQLKETTVLKLLEEFNGKKIDNEGQGMVNGTEFLVKFIKNHFGK